MFPLVAEEILLGPERYSILVSIIDCTKKIFSFCAVTSRNNLYEIRMILP